MMSSEKDVRTFIISVTIIIVSVILGATVYNINDRVLMAKNIDNAIAKSVDPLSVRCAYANPQDMICVAYGASQGHSFTGKK